MYLKKLELKGFKSFADNTEINLNPGINVVVGPNGCGKSNIVDAIRWVLGEANVRHLRGQKGEDVIFNGTDKSRPLGMASVEMTLDNSTNLLPVEYSEVMVARKVFRNGESEFSLNKSRVRMKDIGNLFTGTGLGKKGYSIISQGELEQVLNGQPLDRRMILEEACGVIKYRQQRDEVKKRINETGYDLLRVADILSELNSQASDLQVKSTRARKFIAGSEELTKIEQDLLEFELSKVLNDLSGKNEELNKRNQELQVMKEREVADNLILNDAQISLETLRLELTQLKEAKFAQENKKLNFTSELKLSNERIKNNAERLSALKGDEEKYQQLLANITKEVQTRQLDYNQEKTAFEHKKAETLTHTQSLEALEEDIKQFKDKFEAEKNRIFSHLEAETQLKNCITTKEEEIQRLKEKRTRVAIKKEEASNSINHNRLSHSDYEQELSLLDADSAALNKQLTEQIDSKNEVSAKLQIIAREIDQMEKQLRVTNNNLINLKENEEKLMGYSAPVKTLLKSGAKFAGIMGVVGEILQAPEGLELAIETAAGKGLENIIVDKAHTAQAVINYLKSEQAGRVTLLPLDILKVNPLPLSLMRMLKTEEGVLGLASELVAFAPEFTKAIEYLLGRVLIVKDMPTGIRLFKKHNLPLRIVTVEGEIINNSGAMTGGVSKAYNPNSPLKRKNEEKRLMQLQAELNQQLQKYLHKKDGLQDDLTQMEVNLSQIKEALTANSFKHDLLTKQIEVVAQEITATKLKKQEFINEMETMSLEIIDLGELIKAEQARLNEHQHTSTTVTNQLELLRLDIEKKQRDYEVGQERLSSYQDYLTTKAKELENVAHNVEQFIQVKNSYQQALKEVMQTKDTLTLEVEQEHQRIIELTAANKEHEGLTTNLAQTIADKQTLELQQLEKINLVKEILNPLKDKIMEVEALTHRSEIAITRLETELDNLEQKWLEKFRTVPPDHRQILLTSNQVRQLRITMFSLQEEITAIGAVDINAIAEYEEVSQRVAFLAAQFEDLTKAKDALEKLLTETEKIMVKEFNQFFVLANASFTKTFAEIFGGGEAFLALEEGEERLEIGVNIQVKMPGKKTQMLSLLSGGERALTCIAFIFALLRLRPAPFCLLDEIDAALDEANLARFTNFLAKMAVDIQFIIITHRQATIECGQTIYGITMPQEGISSVLTLNLAEAESLAG